MDCEKGIDMQRSPTWFLAAVLAVFLTACGGSEDKGPTTSGDGGGGGDSAKPTLKFTAIPGEDPSRLQEKFGPVAEYLSEQLGVPVEYVPAAKYSASVEMFKNGDVMLAWFGGLTGVQARHFVKGAEAIVQGVEDPKYKSYFLANADSGLKPGDDFPMDIAGKTFTFGSKSSTSGRLMPEHFIRKNTGKSPAEFLGSEPKFSNSHDLTCEWVEKGVVQVGVVSYTTYDRRVKEGDTDPAKCFILWKTPDYPDYNFTAHPKLEETYGAGFTKKLQKALLDMKSETLLAGFQRTGMIPAKNSDFAVIKELAMELGLLR
ncbi:MAG: putative selenate ABC transporter substrate-binding protein [Planctomycetota bacterium]|nr:putative selenate ABC transporter substrate-binding protein [Planctomycetota bacterium]